MGKSFWKGAISLGMVVIPVRLQVATKSRRPAFHMLHKTCMTRVKQALRCERDNEYLAPEEIVRGYEWTKDQYVVLNDEDFDKVPVGTAHTIEILGFVKATEIDPVYYSGCYYLEPEELAVKPFSLLNQALTKTGRVGLAKVTFQRREHLCLLRPVGDTLFLHTMYYHDEVLPRPEAVTREATAAEMELAMSLVVTMTKTFNPEEYRDEYRLALERLIEAKIRGQEVPAPKPKKVEVADLMAALRASIEAARAKTESTSQR